MSDHPVRQLTAVDGPRAFDTLTSAFREDPVERWMYPELDQYLEHFPRFAEAFGGRALTHQSAWQLGDSAGVAMWLPPGVAVDGDAVAQAIIETVAPEKLGVAVEVAEQMEVVHPTFEHWYLPLFGVDALLQGTGLGGQLMTACLTEIDRTHIPAYLESSNPRNIPFYERHGFVVTGTVSAGTFPPLTCMHRAAG